MKRLNGFFDYINTAFLVKKDNLFNFSIFSIFSVLIRDMTI